MKLAGLLACVCVGLFAVAPLRAASDTARVDGWRLGAVCGVTAGAFVYGHAIQNTMWWKGDEAPFHFEFTQDWKYALGEDKYGHFFFPQMVATLYDQLFLWCGVDSGSAQWAASGWALAYETYVEVRDGFSKAWGFSWGDWTADFFGAAWPLAQHALPALRPLRWKISYDPSAAFEAGAHKYIIDDYESTYGWLSANVHNISGWTWWPAWINIAVGHSVKDLDGIGGGHHEFYLGIDWNLEGIPATGFLKTLLRDLNFYHLPAPTVRIAPDWWVGVKL